MQSEFIELVKVVGTFALYVITAVVLLMLFVSILDRHPGRKSMRGKGKDTNPDKP
jgi:hypothetical protein